MMLINLIKKPIRFFVTTFGKKFAKLFDREVIGSEIKTILVFQTGGIGDLLRIFPLLKALRSEFPFARIAILSEYSSDIFKLVDDRSIVNEFLGFDFKKKTFLEKMSFLLKLRRRNFDLIVSPSRGAGMFECAIISFLIGRKWRAGFTKDGIGFLYTNKIEFRYDIPIIKQNIDLLKTIGIRNTSDSISMKIAVPNEDLLFAEGILSEAKGRGRIIVYVSPTVSNHPELFEWPLENFIELSKLLIKEKNAFIVLLGGERDHEMSHFFEKNLEERINFKNLVGKTDLLKVFALIKSGDLFVGNDSGLLHIANAFGIPSVGIFGPSSPEQVISPLNGRVIIIRHNAHCSPCYVHQPDFDFRCEYKNKCLTNITVDDVVRAIDRLLTGSL